MKNTASCFHEADIVIQKRSDGMYDLLKHRNINPRNGLTLREAQAYVNANPRLKVLYLAGASAGMRSPLLESN